MPKILIATHNQGKLKRYKNLFSDFADLDMVSLQDLNINFKFSGRYTLNPGFFVKEFLKKTVIFPNKSEKKLFIGKIIC